MDSHTTGPGFKTRWVWYTFYQASDWLPPYQHHRVDRSLMCVEGRARISRSGLTHDIKHLVSCLFQFDIPYQWIAQHQVGRVSVHCDGVGCRVLCLQHGIPYYSIWLRFHPTVYDSVRWLLITPDKNPKKSWAKIVSFESNFTIKDSQCIVVTTDLELMFGGHGWWSVYNSDIHSMSMMRHVERYETWSNIVRLCISYMYANTM